MVHVRPPLVRLQAYAPERKAPGAALLASNESPYGLLPGVAARLTDLTAHLSRYPDMGAARLLKAPADRHGVTTDRIWAVVGWAVAGPGSGLSKCGMGM